MSAEALEVVEAAAAEGGLMRTAGTKVSPALGASLEDRTA